MIQQREIERIFKGSMQIFFCLTNDAIHNLIQGIGDCGQQCLQIISLLLCGEYPFDQCRVDECSDLTLTFDADRLAEDDHLMTPVIPCRYGIVVNGFHVIVFSLALFLHRIKTSPSYT